jgi:hypothetical protein
MPTFITPTSVKASITVGSTWTDLDLSALVPSGATGVLLLFETLDPGTGIIFGVRKNGSTDNLQPYLNPVCQRQFVIGVDGSRIIEYFSDNTDTAKFELTVLAYFGSEAVFFTNAVSKGNLSNTYTSFSIASDTGADTATAAVVYANTYGFGCRKTGSTDSLDADDASTGHCSFVGVDGSETFEAGDYVGGTNPIYLIGYLTTSITWNLNAIDRSTATTGSFVNLPTQVGAIGYIYNAKSSASGTFTVRKQSGTVDPFKLPESTGSGQVTSEGPCEQKISATTLDIYERGYFTAAVGTGSVAWLRA